MGTDLRYWLGFNIVKGIGPAKLRVLLDHFGSLERAWAADRPTLKKIGIDERTIRSFFAARSVYDLDAELAKVQEKGVQVLCWDSPDYPYYLRQIPSAPPVLFVQGEIQEIDRWAVAIVGTRRLSAYGRQLTHEITAGLVRQGVTIVSGLAKGIDSVAHTVAVEMGGRTIAVLGSGLNHIYPSENRALAQRIAPQHGAVVSEYALDTPPEAKNFPPRNRIISGLSLGTVVIEAGERSGALITARFATEQHRELYALPGNVTTVASKGTNRLIQDGAKLITCAEDILIDLNLERSVEQQAVQIALPDSAEEAALLPHLSRNPQHLDELSRASQLAPAQASSTLMFMELKGVVKQVGSMNYVLVHEVQVEYHV